MEEILNAITWHHLTFIFAVIFIFAFRSPLSNLIRRTTKIDKEGLVAEPSAESQREDTKTSTEAVQQLLDVVGNSIVINEQEQSIKNELTAKGLPSDTNTAKVLIKHLAGAQLLLAFERIHSSIFGSQIFLLKKLNEVAGQGRNTDFVHKHIDRVKELYPDNLGSWTYEQYLNFLFAQLLITKNDNQIHITNLGVEYLTWVARNGRREDNPL
ncbi:MAG: hypothetical protein AB1450_12545 [Pseudomonadota bacterium]